MPIHTVIHPGTSVDNSVPRQDGTAGNRLQSSSVVIDDSGGMVSDAGTFATTAYVTSAVDAAIVGLYDHKGSYDAYSNDPDLDVSPSGVLKADAYTVSVAGTFFTAILDIGDVLIADQDDPTLESHWTIVNRNIDETAFAAATHATNHTDGTDDIQDATAAQKGLMTAAYGAKLDGIEALADVTDTANVTAAGALMDSEVDADLKTFVLPASTTISAFGATLVDDATAGDARTTLGVDASGTDNSTDVTLAGTGTYISIAGQVITVDLITESDISDLQGYVVGPASAVDNEVPTFDATTGKLIQAGSDVFLSSAGYIFNESGADVDFRIESSVDANSFFVDGLTGNVGIGTASPVEELHVEGRMMANILSNTGGWTYGFGIASGNGVLFVDDNVDVTVANAFARLSNSSGAGQFFLDDNGTLNIQFKANGNSFIKNDIFIVGDSAANGTSEFQVAGDVFVRDNLGINTNAPGAAFDCDGDAIFNESGADVDFRVESSASNAELFVDGLGGIGIGTSTVTDDINIVGKHDIVIKSAGNNPQTLKMTSASNGQTIILESDSASVGGGADSKIEWWNNGASKWVMGFDDPSSDFKIARDNTWANPFLTIDDGTDEVVFNESGVARDFRIESDGKTHLFFIDGTTNAVGIGAAPSSGEILDVTGKSTFSDDVGIGAAPKSGVRLDVTDNNPWLSIADTTSAADHVTLRAGGQVYFSDELEFKAQAYASRGGTSSSGLKMTVTQEGLAIIGGATESSAANDDCRHLVIGKLAAVDYGMTFLTNPGKTNQIAFADSLSAPGNVAGRFIYTHDASDNADDSLKLLVNALEVFRCHGSGDMSIGGTTADTDLHLHGVLTLDHHGAPATPATSNGAIWAISGEVKVMDDSGNETTISPHNKDAPLSIYNEMPGLESVVGYKNYYRAELRWVNLEDTTKPTMIESFDEYNARRAGEPGHVDLVPRDWDEEDRLAHEQELAEWAEYTEALKRRKRLPWHLRDDPPTMPKSRRKRTKPVGVA